MRRLAIGTILIALLAAGAARATVIKRLRLDTVIGDAQEILSRAEETVDLSGQVAVSGHFAGFTADSESADPKPFLSIAPHASAPPIFDTIPRILQ